ncbi:hypothetical protein GGD55_001736 [Rhizobium giardinii]|uniref:Uncharacterized protein n=1 Tax=Rhizobium giardinii TaxID=56731 RepID=A0A7W8X900_9HYPH|nr:hypothetical protein [Rhizobium giardinii]
MLLYEIMDEDAIAMMRRVLSDECVRRSIQPDSPTGEELALIILNAFGSGMTEELVTMLVRVRG